MFAEQSGTFLELKKLSFSLEGATILDGISFQMNKGEFLAVIGPNGAGKSTLMRCIDRVYITYGGEVCLGGRPTSRLSPKQLAQKIAYVPQGAGDTDVLTVSDMVYLARYPWKKTFEPESAEDVRIVRESMELCGISAFADRTMDSLSGGERQKVMIAAALAQQSEVLLLDEPTAYLDYRHQVELLKLIRLIHEEGRKTILVVTHDLNFALQSADRLLVMEKGRLVWEGSPSNLLKANLIEGLFSTKFLYLEQEEGRLPFIIPAAFSGRARI